MGNRLQMQISGARRPLQFSGGERPGMLFSNPQEGEWPGLSFELHRMGGWQGDEEFGPVSGTQGLLVYLGGSVEFLGRVGGRQRSWSNVAGDATLVSGDECPRLLRCRGAADVAVVELSHPWIRAFTGQGEPAVGATMRLGQQRRLVCLVRELLAHAQRPALNDPLAVEVLSFDVLGQVLQAVPCARSAFREDALSPVVCRRIQDYVQGHLEQRISLSELAALTECKSRHFSTLFKRAFHVTPYQYVLRARLSEAARLLRTTRAEFAEIAYRTGFSSQSHLSTAFARAFGVSPRDYARRR